MKIQLVLAFIILYNLLLSVSSSAHDEEASSTYIIHLDSNLMPKPFTSHLAWHSSILSSSKPIYSYTNAIHGFSARLTPSQLEEIQKYPAFLFSTKDMPLQLATTHSSEFLGLDSFSGAWPASDFGRDVIIGVVDTGVWPESRSFSNDEGMGHIPSRWRGGCFGGIDFNSSLCNKKLIGVRYFNKGIKAAYPNDTFYDSARDTNGHGTHVSSIAAGNFIHGTSYYGYGTGTGKGMAPRARLAAYKVRFSGKYELYASDVVAAIDSAIEDGIDVLSLSIATSPPLYHDPVAIATFAAMENSIFVTSAAGNSGPSLNTISVGAPWHLTVGAGTIGRSFTGNIALGSGALITGVSLCPLSPNILANLPIIFLKDCGREEGLTKYAKIVVCSVSAEYEFSSLGSYFHNFGVAGAVLIWSKTNNSYLAYLPDEEIGFPAIVLNAANGKVVLDYIENNNDKATATLLFKETIHGTKPAPGVARFSSRGPSQACPFILKPDIMAPGYQILASWQEKNPDRLVRTEQLIKSFSVESGTSIASPHAAGVAALLKGAHPEWSPAAIRNRGEKKSYKLRVYGPCLKEGTILHGSVSWEQIGGSRTVRSPIVVAGLNPNMGKNI
ncbi:hypothetical protein ACJIZ3_019748 [Penstemon smallii]|uniref:Subtilisin-like protease n=1 Tax=Penstemon smallii TaxID=265156 RepID=A0ABD3T203_9LAMI